MPPAADLILWSAADAGAWSANAAPGSSAVAAVAADGALRLDLALGGHGSWAIARRPGALTLPAHYVLALTLRGELPPCELQVKLIGTGGADVWWWRRPAFSAPRRSTRLMLRRASLEFAWGPRSGGDPDHLAAVELAIAGTELAGRLWIEDLRLIARQPPDGPVRAQAASAASAAPGTAAAAVLDDDPTSHWEPAAAAAPAWLAVDFGAVREWGGLAIEFAAAPAPPSRLLGSDDGATWQPLGDDPGGAGRRRWLRTGEVESRFARLEFPAGAAVGVSRLRVVPIELAVSPARWAAAQARQAPRGQYPRHLLGEQAYWAVVGGDGDARKGLLSEDGALEVDAEAFTLEPFLLSEGRLLTWADATTHQSLAEDCLPVPTTTWETGSLRLRVTACASGAVGASAVLVRYRVENATAAPRQVRLIVAVRPFQVTPAWQSLNLVGGVAPIATLAADGARLRVGDTRGDCRDVVAVTAPTAIGAVRSDEGLARLLTTAPPPRGAAEDPLGFAEGALCFDLALAGGGSADVVLAVPLFAATPAPPAGLAAAAAAAWGAARLDEAVAHWRARLAVVPIALPPAAAPLEQALRASLAWILVNRDGPRIQPGSRTYRRSWIRDGALTGTALAELGFGAELDAFLRWYAPYQFEDGRVPCAVDHRGVDLVVEHDSHGQFIYAAVESWRLSGDATLLRELWPRLLRAADAIAALRAARTTPAYRGTAAYGLLPESISHEGYSSQPVHAYWDDFFAVRGLADAAQAAAFLGDAAAPRLAALHAAMRADVLASLAHTMEAHALAVLPGSVELGDFDPTSSAIAFDPCGLGTDLPRGAVEATFERYWQEFAARRAGRAPNDAYTPYEVRTATALLHLGWSARGLELLAWLVGDQRPPAWRQWPEIAWTDGRAPRFLGDLPHGWVASSFCRAVRRLLAYEREDGALVLAAGVPEAWVRSGPGVRLRGLPTHFGPLDLTLVAVAADCVRATFGASRCRPPGGVVIESPLARPLREIVVDGRTRAAADPLRVWLAEVPSAVDLRY